MMPGLFFKEYKSYLDFALLLLLILANFFYAILMRSFAEIHLDLPFLDFPVFIGEILLAVCLIITMLRWRVTPVKIPLIGAIFLVGYVVFVTTKLVIGYIQYGPLACRHAAMFYYPLFALFSLGTLPRVKELNSLTPLVILLLVTSYLFIELGFHLYPFIIFACLLSMTFPNKVVRFLYLLLVLMTVPWSYVFVGARTIIIAIAFSFILMTLLFLKMCWGKKILKVLIGLLCLGALGISLLFLIPESTKQAMSPQIFMEAIKVDEAFIEKKSQNFVMLERDTKIYTKTVDVEFKSCPGGSLKIIKDFKCNELNQYELSQALFHWARIAVSSLVGILLVLGFLFFRFLQKEKVSQLFIGLNLMMGGVIFLLSLNPKPIQTILLPQRKIESFAKDMANNANLNLIPNLLLNGKKTVPQDTTPQSVVSSQGMANSRGTISPPNTPVANSSVKKDNPASGLNAKYGQAIFRLHILRDMIDDLVEYKPIFGFSFGKPFRSKRLEITRNARSEWERDGWIASHNSFMEVIYRAGVIGIFYLGLLFWLIIKVLKSIIQQSFYPGIFLIAIISYWLFCALFLIVWEMPYYAIPFWSLFGLLLSILYEDRESKLKAKEGDY